MGPFDTFNAEFAETVKSIGSEAFSYYSHLVNVDILYSVKSIESFAFYGCTGLKSIDFSSSPSDLTNIGSAAFGSCSELTEIDIPNSVTIIGNSAFSSCVSLKRISIPNSVIHIGNGVFSRCSSITEIDIPKSVQSINPQAFYQNTSLAGINISPDNDTYSSFDGIVYNKDKTNLVRCPPGKSGAVIIPDSVTDIGSCAFASCSKLTEVSIPDSVTNVGSGAFADCENLASIDIPESVEFIGSSAFQNTQIKTITIPPSVHSFGINGASGPFYMILLENIVFKSDTEDIAANAFVGIMNPVNVFIPKSVAKISEDSGLGAKTKVCAFAESFAEQYAIENDIPYKILPTILPETDMPPNGYQYLPYSFKFKSSEGSWLEVVDGKLPKGLEISLEADGKRQLGEIYGAPLETGEFKVTVRATDGNVYPLEDDEITFTIVIEDKLPQAKLDEINAGRLLEPLGEYISAEDIYSVDIFDTNPEDMEIKFANDYIDFIDLWIDGLLQEENTDYRAESGSTVVTLYGQTFSKLDSGKDHMLAGEFKVGGKAEGEQSKAAQNFKVNVIKQHVIEPPPDPELPPANPAAPAKLEPPTKPEPPLEPELPLVPDPKIPSGGGGGGGGASTGNQALSPLIVQTQEPIPKQIPEPPPEQDTFTGIFSDVKETDWFYSDVKWAYEENIMIGVSQTTFAPYAMINPAMISVTLARMIGVDLNAYDGGEDNRWFSAAFAWACDIGLFAGIDELSHDMPFNRGRLAVALAKLTSDAGLAAPATDRDEEITASDAALKFSEGSDVNGRDDDITASDAELESAVEPNADEKGDDTTASDAALMSADEVGPTDDDNTTSDALLMLAEELDSTGDEIIASKDVLIPAKELKESIENFIALDAELMSVEELDAFRLLYQLGILKGRGNGIMDPLNIPTRAELAAILHRLDKYAMGLRNIFGALSKA